MKEAGMLSNQAIETFAREVLGCNCPAEVFQHIECQDKASLGHDSPLSYHINIGNRLLVYVVACSSIETLERTIVSLLRQGKHERDTRGFNRFRLVLTTDQPDALNPLAQENFNASNSDEKLHLHVVDAAFSMRLLLSQSTSKLTKVTAVPVQLTNR